MTDAVVLKIINHKHYIVSRNGSPFLFFFGGEGGENTYVHDPLVIDCFSEMLQRKTVTFELRQNYVLHIHYYLSQLACNKIQFL